MSITCTGVSPAAESWIWRYHCPAIRGESTRRVNETGWNSAEFPDNEAVVSAVPNFHPPGSRIDAATSTRSVSVSCGYRTTWFQSKSRTLLEAAELLPL